MTLPETGNKVKALRDFFSVPGKPVTSVELMDFAKHDRKGYDELAELCLKAQITA